VLFGRTIDEGVAAYVAMALAGTIGYTIGSIGGWAIGLYGGRPYVERHGRWLHLDAAKLDRAERWFERWEDWAVFLGRLTPVIRSFVSIPAGVIEVPFVRYSLLTLAGSAIWCFVFAGIGYAVGGSWEDFHHAFRYVEYVVAAAIAAIVVWLAVRDVRRRRRSVGEESSTG
jgi:membrane protein DedA with SNARE-associated domain